MTNNKIIFDSNIILGNIFTFRRKEVMFDADLAKLYGVELKRLNEQVKRNIERFPKEFRFQLTKEEHKALMSQRVTIERQNKNLRTQIATSSKHGGRRYLPYVFTEQGVAMLSAVLHSDTAVKVSIQIMQAFVQMRHLTIGNAGIFQRLDKVEQKQIETDDKFKQLFDALENKSLKSKQGIFFDGQIFDAYVFINDIVKSAEKSIILIDNYIDETVLTLLSKRNKNCEVVIYTKKISTLLKLDLEKHNAQYPTIKLKILQAAHDRFLIIDKDTIYHIGASLKDLGEKWFAFSKLEIDVKELIDRL